MPTRILACVDFSDATDLVVAQAARLAHALGAKVQLIHVSPPEPDFVGYGVGPQHERDGAAAALRHEHQRLQELERRLRAEGLDTTSMLVPGEPATKLVQETERSAPDLVVLGSHGHGALHHLLAGSVCSAVLKHARCPVLVVPVRR